MADIERAQVKVSPRDYAALFTSSEQWPETVHPERYDWFLTKGVYIETLNPPTRDDYANDWQLSDEEIEENLQRMDAVIERIHAGLPVWPILIGTDGHILDGYHRLAAQAELGIEEVDVLQARPKRKRSSAKRL